MGGGITLLIGILFLLLGIVIRYFIGRRRFYRRTYGKMQAFKNYNQALIISAIERIFSILSSLLIIGGIFILLIYTYSIS